MASTISFSDVEEASARILPFIEPSPLAKSVLLSRRFGLEVFCKYDSSLETGSFKERGALNFLLQLSPEQKKAGVCAASMGNHALGLSKHASHLGVACTVCMPITASLTKKTRVRHYGGEVLETEGLFEQSRLKVDELVASKGMTRVPPYDHPWIIAGQGSSGIEIANDLPDFDSIIVPVGGGGLIAGVAIALKRLVPKAKIIGVRSSWANAMGRADLSKRKGIFPLSLAEGIAVKNIGDLSKPIIDELVDEVIEVDENQIAYALAMFLDLQHTLVEGAAAAGVAGLEELSKTKSGRKLLGNKVVLAICGSNIDLNIVSGLIAKYLRTEGRLAFLHLSVPDRDGVLAYVAETLSSNRASIIEVVHDRICAHTGHTDMRFTVEISGPEHLKEIKQALVDIGVQLRDR